jgi:hypothetical protein
MLALLEYAGESENNHDLHDDEPSIHSGQEVIIIIIRRTTQRDAGHDAA